MDMPGGGDSGLPYIKFGIEEETASTAFKKYFQINRTSLDFPARGGSVTQVLGQTPQTPSSEIDRIRIEKFLKEDRRGAAFLLKQKGLQSSNPKIQTGDAFYKSVTEKLPGLFINTQVYNDNKNLLAQVSTMGTGNHITRIGNVINNVQERYYADIVGRELTMEVAEVQRTNRLTILANLKLDQKTQASFLGINYISNVSENSNDYVDTLTLERLGISPLRDRLFSYLGGPGSVYGIGTTTILRATDTTEAADFQLPDGTPMSDLAWTYDKIRNRQGGKTLPQNGMIKNYSDFRNNYAGGTSLNDEGWGKPGNIDVRFFDGRVDKLNKIAQYSLDRSENPFKTDVQPLDVKGTVVNNENRQDLIKFGFECLGNSKEADSVILLFRAYLSSITDNNSATYNGFKYMGRGENFYVYQGFDRTVSFSFKIAIGSREELDSSYKKLNYLISQIYPDYNSLTNFMTSPLIRLTIGDYMYRVHGFLESVNVTIDQNSSWEIDDDNQLPHLLEVQVSFKPILNELPRRGRNMTDVPSIIRQTNVPDTPNETYTPATQQVQNANVIAQNQVNLNLAGGNSLGGVNSGDSFGMSLSAPLGQNNTQITSPTTISSDNTPAKKQAKKVANKKAAVKKASDDKKAASTKSTNTTVVASKNTAPPPAAPRGTPQNINSLGIPTFQKFN